MPFYGSLKVISGKSLSVEGCITVKVSSISGKLFGKTDLVIIRTLERFRSLLGRDLLPLLYEDWKSHFKINSINAIEPQKINFVKEFPKVFDDNYAAEIKDAIADIRIDNNALPIFHGAYTVPYGLRSKVDEELDRLVNCGILEPVKYSRWASPIVVVEKKRSS